MGRKKITLTEFINISNIRHNFEYDYSKVEYINNKNYVIIICTKHGEYSQRADHHMAGNKCIKCGYDVVGKKQTLLFEELKNKCILIHKNKYSYGSNINYYNSKDKIEIVCPIHGIFFQKASIHLKGAGCKVCYDSKGEKQIRNILNKHQINYINEYKFTDCKDKKSLPFDFFLPKHNICIEYDGLQHFKPIKRYGGEQYFNIIKKHDKIKNDYCTNNLIPLLRINYNQNIELSINNLLFSGNTASPQK